MSLMLRAWPPADDDRGALPLPRWRERAAPDGPAPGPAPHEALFAVPVPAARFASPLARLARLSPSVLLNRIKRPLSRWRHEQRDRAIAARFRRPALDRAPENGAVCIIGAFGARNGLGRAARYELDRLLRRHPRAEVVDVTAAGGTALARFAAARAARAADPPALAIFLMQPNLVGRHLAGIDPAAFRSTYRIVLAVWELPYAPPGWAAIEPVFHEFWTPSTFSAEALAQGTRQPVRVVPHPVRLQAPATRRPGCDDTIRGLAIMDLSTCPDRKNPWAHVEAWQKAFGDDPRCILTMKLRFSRRTATIRRELRRMIGSAGNIRIVERELSDADVLAMQAESDLCLSLHRSEGFGLTIREMLDLGKAAVATGWSGNADYMDRYVNAYAVRSTQVPYKDYLGRYPGFSGTWAEADTDHAARCLRVVATRRWRAARSAHA